MTYADPILRARRLGKDGASRMREHDYVGAREMFLVAADAAEVADQHISARMFRERARAMTVVLWAREKLDAEVTFHDVAEVPRKNLDGEGRRFAVLYSAPEGLLQMYVTIDRNGRACRVPGGWKRRATA